MRVTGCATTCSPRGVSETLVDDALAHAVEDYRDAPVHTFIGVLVERQVRESLGLRSPRLHDTAD
jgi:hypothetical protein